MLRKGNYTDEKFKQIENQFNILKSLMNDEPVVTTQKDEPIRDWSIITNLITN